MKIGVSKTVFTRMKNDVLNKRKKVQKEIAELKVMEASLKHVKTIKLSKR